MATNSAQHVDVGLKPIAPSSANVSAESSSSRTTSRQSDPEPVTLRKATGLNPNVLPQVMTVKDRDIGGIYDKVIHRNNWAIDTCVPTLVNIGNTPLTSIVEQIDLTSDISNLSPKDGLI
jgi:hypothetical protein